MKEGKSRSPSSLCLLHYHPATSSLNYDIQFQTNHPPISPLFLFFASPPSPVDTPLVVLPEQIIACLLAVGLNTNEHVSGLCVRMKTIDWLVSAQIRKTHSWIQAQLLKGIFILQEFRLNFKYLHVADGMNSLCMFSHM